MFNKYKNEIRRLREENAKLLNDLDTMTDAPEGCKRGAWCAACAWNIRVPHFMIGACTLGACNNFVQRETPKK